MTKNATISGSKVIKSAKGTHLHHLFPQEFAKEFKEMGIIVDDFVIALEAEKHIGKGGIHLKTDYNGLWHDFFYGGGKRTKAEAAQLLNQLFIEMGLDLSKYLIGSKITGKIR